MACLVCQVAQINVEEVRLNIKRAVTNVLKD